MGNERVRDAIRDLDGDRPELHLDDSPDPGMPQGTKWLLVTIFAVFGLQMTGLGPAIRHWFALWPMVEIVDADTGLTLKDSRFHFWQLLTYGLLHGSVLHIGFNAFGLWMFGSIVEQVWGAKRYLVYVVVCVIGAALTQQLVEILTAEVPTVHFSPRGWLMDETWKPTVGASGGLFGVLLAFALMYPQKRLYLFGLIPAPAKPLVFAYGAVELGLGLWNTLGKGGGAIAHFAHLGGMLFGLLLLLYWTNRLPVKPPPGKLL